MKGLNIFNHIKIKHSLFLWLILSNFTYAQAPKIKDYYDFITFDIELTAQQNITLPTIDVRDTPTDRKNIYLSEFYNLYRGDRIGLYQYIVSRTNVFDFPIFDGIYNLNYRGFNTSPINYYNPFSVSVNDVVFYHAYTTPSQVYLLAKTNFNNNINTLKSKSSGMTGDISTQTNILSETNTGIMGAELDLIEQKVAGVISGPVGDSGLLYGISANLSYRKGSYNNAKSDENQNDVDLKNFDNQLSSYFNGFLAYAINDNAEINFNSTFSSQNRGSIRGYQTTVEDFYEKFTAEDLEKNKQTSGYYSDINSFNNDDGLNFSLGLLFYGQASETNINARYMTNSIKSLQDLDRGDPTTLNATDTKKEDFDISAVDNNFIDSQKFNLSIDWKMLPISEHQLYANLNYSQDSQTTDNVSRNLIFASILGDDKIDIDYNYNYVDTFIDLNTGYKYETNKTSIEVGFNLKNHAAKIEQKSKIDGSSDLIIEGINLRLTNLGYTSQYKIGNKNYDVNYNDTVLLPKFHAQRSFHFSNIILVRANKNSQAAKVRENIVDLNLFFNYGMGYTPGGINKLLINVEKDKSFYKPETSHMFDLGFKLDNIYDLDMSFKILVFYNLIQNIHYKEGYNFFELDNANVNKGTSYGLEANYEYLINDNWHINFEFTYNNATYGEFKHELVSNTKDKSLIKDYTGNKIIDTPDYSIALYNALWFREQTLYWGTALNYVGPFYFDYENKLKNKGYFILDTNIGYETENYAFQIFAKNLLNTNYTQGAKYNEYNNTATAIEEAHNKIDDGNIIFDWENTVTKTIGDPLTVGLGFYAFF